MTDFFRNVGRQQVEVPSDDPNKLQITLINLSNLIEPLQGLPNFLTRYGVRAEKPLNVRLVEAMDTRSDKYLRRLGCHVVWWSIPCAAVN